jgi:hypothetical protein
VLGHIGRTASPVRHLHRSHFSALLSISGPWAILSCVGDIFKAEPVSALMRLGFSPLAWPGP